MYWSLENVPWTNLHDLNLDWIVNTMKQTVEQWIAYRLEMDGKYADFTEQINTDFDNFTEQINNGFDNFTTQINNDFDNFTTQINTWKTLIETEFSDLQTYVQDYFDNLDLNESTRYVINQMIDSGEFIQVLNPSIVSTVESWLANHVTPTSPAVDNTLTIAGAAADAKKTGGMFKTSYVMHPHYASTPNHTIEDITEYGSFWLAPSLFDNLPINSPGLLINDSCGTGYIFQTFIPQNASCVFQRLKATGSSGTTSSWREMVLSKASIIALIGENIETYPEIESINNKLDTDTYRMHPHYASTPNHTIEDITEYGSFWLAPSLFNDLPINSPGLLINDSCGTGYIFQTFIPQNSKTILQRVKATGSSGTTSSWKTLIPPTDTMYLYHGNSTSVNNLTADGTYYVPASTITDITHLPVDETVMINVYKLNNDYVKQVISTVYGYAEYYRFLALPGGSGTTSKWYKISQLEDLRVITFGDSITAGYRNNGKGYIGLCNVRDYKNAAHSGDSLANLSGRNHVYSQLTASSAVINYNADVVIISGGFNDYANNAPLGNMPTAPITSDAQFDAMDDTTVSGGLQKALYLGIKQYPDAQKAFLITHRTSTYPYTPNTAGYTQTEMFNFIKDICRLYGYVIIDIFNDSSLNTAFDCYVSPVDYSTPSEAALTARYAVNSDRIHPLQYGYVNYYVPIVNQYLQTCTRKMPTIPF